jgi:Ca2+-binding EF-hand superfamily protein
MSIDEGRLREVLRPVFDKFDTDASGFISTPEMKAMCKELQMELTPEQMQTMMVEADPDRSGEVDFDEFVR